MNARGYTDGYLTVEAALILPFALVVILLVMQIWFYKYDRMLMTTETSAAVIRAGEQREMSSDELADYLMNEMQNRYRDHYIAWNFGEISVSATSDSVSCTVDGSGPDLLGGLAFWRDHGALYASVTRSRTTISEVFVIRSYRKMLGTYEDMQEVIKSD